MKHSILVFLATAGLASGCGSSVETTTGGAGGQGTTSASSSSGATASSSSSSSSTSTSSSTSASSSSGSAACDATNCAPPFICCGDLCVNPDNDILNCGKCGIKCGGVPYCDAGTCGAPPCTTPQQCGPAGVCCGATCCAPGEICCAVPGPIDMGPHCQKPDPQTMTCDKGCPACVCASPDTPIATPLGERPIADLRPGDLVYSVEGEAVVAVPVARINRAPVRDHQVIRVRLAGGRSLEISAPHPTADGRNFGALRAGGALDGITIESVEVVPYRHPFTHDILPASSTGVYYAAGALVGSTLTADR